MMEKNRNIPGENPFKVPEDYFKELNRKIIAETTGEKSAGSRIGLIRRLRPYLAVAASVAGLIILSYAGIKIFNRVNNDKGILYYASEENPGLVLYEIDLLTLEEKAFGGDLSDKGSGADSKAIIDYLVLENIDINDIYDQL